MGKYTPHYAAFDAEVLNAPFMVALMAERIARAKAVAEAIAPDAPPFGVGYKEAFETSVGTHGGDDGKRAYGRLENTDPYAHIIEFGSKDQTDRIGRHHGATPAHRTLGKAIDAAR